MKVIGDRVLVQKAKMPDKYHGIILAETTKEEGKVAFNVGLVLDFGTGVKTWNGETIPGYQGKVGDFVVWEQFGEFSCGDVLGKGKWILRNEDIIAILDEEEVKDWEFRAEVKETNETEAEQVVEEDRKKKCQCENKDCKAQYKVIEVSIKSIKDSLPQCEYCGSELTGVIEGAPMFDAKLTPKFH